MKLLLFPPQTTLTELRCHASPGETWVRCIMGKQPEILHDTLSSAGTSLRSEIKWLILVIVFESTCTLETFFFLHSVCLLRSLRTSTRMTSTRTYCRNLTTQQISCHSQSLEPQKPLYRYMCVFFSLRLSPHLIYLHLFLFHYLFHYFIRFFVLSIAGPLAHVNTLSSMPMYMLLRTASITFI